MSSTNTACEGAVATRESRKQEFDYGSLAKEWMSCPVCGGTEFDVLCRTDRYLMGLSTAKCQGCGLIMTNPCPTEAGLREFYTEHYRRYYRKLERPDLSYIRRYALDRRAEGTTSFLVEQGCLKAGMRVLDVGCGEGSLLKAIGLRMPDAERCGVEPYLPFAEFAGELAGCPIANDVGELEQQGRGCDLITLSHVLEHIRRPAEFLSRLGGLLSPGGKLFVDVPDVRGYRWLADLHIAHIYHFSPATLVRTANRAGLVVQSLSCHQPPKLPPCIRAVLSRDGSGVPVEENREEDRRVADKIRRMGAAAGLFNVAFNGVMASYELAWNLMGRLKIGNNRVR